MNNITSITESSLESKILPEQKQEIRSRKSAKSSQEI